MKKISRAKLALLLLVYGTLSCDEKTSDCLDSFAANYSVDADEPCNFCCTYPLLQTDFNHKYTVDGVQNNLSYGSVLFDSDKNPFKIERIAFYLSGFSLTGSKAPELRVEDELSFEAETAPGRLTERLITDDIVYVNPGDLGALTLGTIIGEGNYEQLGLRLGLPEETSGLVLSTLPDGHSLEMQNDTSNLNQEGDYVVFRIDYFPDTTQNTRLETVAFSAQELSLDLKFDLPFFLPRGSKVGLIWTMDYSAWLEQINFRVQDNVQIKEQIRSNLAEAFTLSAVSIQ
jgi:hypothetical protein